MPIRVLLADDHGLVRQGLKAWLERQSFGVVGDAPNGQEALQIAASAQPDVAIIDVAMPILNGIETARQMKALSPSTKVILLTQHAEDQYVTEALRAGVKGYVLKSQVADDLLHAIREVCRGSVYLSPGISGTLVGAYLSKSDVQSDPLSGRERQVLQLVGEGRSTKEVAAQLGISIKTVESHRARLRRKLDIHETAGLVLYAIRRGLIQP